MKYFIESYVIKRIRSSVVEAAWSAGPGFTKRHFRIQAICNTSTRKMVSEMKAMSMNHWGSDGCESCACVKDLIVTYSHGDPHRKYTGMPPPRK